MRETRVVKRLVALAFVGNEACVARWRIRAEPLHHPLAITLADISLDHLPTADADAEFYGHETQAKQEDRDRERDVSNNGYVFHF